MNDYTIPRNNRELQLEPRCGLRPHVSELRAPGTFIKECCPVI